MQPQHLQEPIHLMSISRFFDENIVIRRLKTISGQRKSFQATATVEAHIQESSPEARQILGILEERAWVAWMAEESEIEEGDQVTGADGKVYHVREITIKDYGINRHREVLLVEQNS